MERKQAAPTVEALRDARCPHCDAPLIRDGFRVHQAFWRTRIYHFYDGAEGWPARENGPLELLEHSIDAIDGGPVEWVVRAVECGRCGERIPGDLAHAILAAADRAEDLARRL